MGFEEVGDRAQVRVEWGSVMPRAALPARQE